MTEEHVNEMLKNARGALTEKQARTILKHREDREDREEYEAEKAAAEAKPKAEKPKGK